MDIVLGIRPNGKLKCAQVAGTVALVNFRNEVVYSAKIFRPADSYVVSKVSVKLNGITATTLQEKGCSPLDEVQSKITELCRKKLVIGLAMEQDFTSLGLRKIDFNTFDLQQHYFKIVRTDRKGNAIVNPQYGKLGLGPLVQHYYGVAIHGEQTHTAEEDAEWTMKVFLEQYCPLQRPSKDEMENWDELEYFLAIYQNI